MVNIKVSTNIDELEEHLNKVFKNMFKSQELQNAGREVGKAIGKHVEISLAGGGDSGYDYTQSGDLKRLIKEEAEEADVKGFQNKLSIGVFDLENMNLSVYAKRNWQYQVHDVWDSEQHEFTKRTISLKQENQMPKWILAEFGSGKYRDENANISRFGISYAPREDKEYMYGPSIGNVRGPGGGSKRGFFMVSQRGLENLLGP
ncbi:MAG TPA: hypothetical protein VKU94_03860, partial [Geobacterales bacterium]|nr:hypothetical protein [Geobacterales bacterium]